MVKFTSIIKNGNDYNEFDVIFDRNKITKAEISDLRKTDSSTEHSGFKVLIQNVNSQIAYQALNETNKKEIGLSAQEVNKVLPELVDLAPFDTIRDENDNIVSKSGENYLTISYERLMPVIVESIKQLNNEIKLLKEYYKWKS